jgi:methylisocitrate lyase
MASKGRTFRDLANNSTPLLIAGATNACCALLAKQAGFKAIYLSGAGLANADYGLPDLGITSLDNVVDLVRKITQAVDLPLLVDGDTGWGSALNVARTVQQLCLSGAAGVHFEDQVFPKRCGHRSGKVLASIAEMSAKISAAVNARSDHEFVIMARKRINSQVGNNNRQKLNIRSAQYSCQAKATSLACGV